MTEFEREERAFRNAMSEHASEAPVLPLVAPPARRRHKVAVIAAAAAAAVVICASLAVPALYGGKGSSDPPVAQRGLQLDDSKWQWVGLHAVEVPAPIDWGFAREAVRP